MTSPILARNNVTEHGVPDGRPMVLAHGFGCDQHMWRDVWPAFAEDHRIVLFDHVGAGASDLGAYDVDHHSRLEGYAEDVVEVLEALDLHDVVFVGHSVSAMIGVLAAIQAPDRFSQLFLVGPSPRYVNDGDYVGGFEQADIEELLEVLDSNYLGWSSTFAPVIMGNPERPELADELEAFFCRTDPEIASRWARVTFLSDNRDDLARLQVPAVVLQCSEDVIAPESVGRYVHEQLPQSTFVQLKATGHIPNLSAPEETSAVIREHLAR